MSFPPFYDRTRLLASFPTKIFLLSSPIRHLTLLFPSFHLLAPDEDASGDLSREEVLAQLRAKKGVFSDSSAVAMMSEARWKELDWDGDGHITFREFVWAFQSWISEEDA